MSIPILRMHGYIPDRQGKARAYCTCILFKRTYEPLEHCVKSSNIPVLSGPRQVGKPALLNNYLTTTALAFYFHPLSLIPSHYQACVLLAKTKMRIPAMSSTDSRRSRPLVPMHAVHSFQSMSSTEAVSERGDAGYPIILSAALSRVPAAPAVAPVRRLSGRVSWRTVLPRRAVGATCSDVMSRSRGAAALRRACLRDRRRLRARSPASAPP